MAENLLLASLPENERERLDPFLVEEQLPIGKILIEPNEPIQNLYFPFDCITSTVQQMSDGTSVETGLMGVEGLVGIQLWLRSPRTSTTTLVQVAGTARRMRSEDFIAEVMNNPGTVLNALIAKYVHAFMSMTSVTAACNRIHRVEQRMCRWLKMVQNRLSRDEFAITQDFMAQMLGVSRPSVSITANILKAAGLIEYSRGNLRIVDSDGLRDGACECLGIIEHTVDQIFNQSWRGLAEEEQT